MCSFLQNVDVRAKTFKPMRWQLGRDMQHDWMNGWSLPLQRSSINHRCCSQVYSELKQLWCDTTLDGGDDCLLSTRKWHHNPEQGDLFSFLGFLATRRRGIDCWWSAEESLSDGCFRLMRSLCRSFGCVSATPSILCSEGKLHATSLLWNETTAAVFTETLSSD